MKYNLTKKSEISVKEKHGITVSVYPNIGNCGFVIIETKSGHNQEFYDKESSFNYIILSGQGCFYINGEEVPVQAGDTLSIESNNRFYYKGAMKLALITNPSWKPENEVEVRAQVW